MSKGGWKKFLLKSGVPLEYEAAQVLTKRGMGITADFSYMRRDGAAEKECSVDLHGFWYDCGDVNFRMDILVECKYRSQNKSILFLPDPNVEYLNGTHGGTVSVIDNLSTHELNTDIFQILEEDIPTVYKGIEVSDDGAYEQELLHGINQLRYGTPPALRGTLDFILRSHPDDRIPIFFTKVLVTNASLRVLKAECDLTDIEGADTLDEISTPAERLILFSDYGPDFEQHFRRSFSDSGSRSLERAEAATTHLRSTGRVFSQFQTPSALYQDLQSAARYRVYNTSTQFFVVTLGGLDSLIHDIQQACLATFAKRTELSM